MSRLYFRLDDITPNMNWDKFNFIVSLFKRYNVKPLLAIIPDNKDPELLKCPVNPNFWRIIKELKQDGWTIAQHGYQHLYKIQDGGILGINKRGEFAGVDFEIQKQMINSGKDIMKEKVCEPKIFVAPGHSFDKNTIRVLKESGFNCVSDGIALYPFKKWGLIWTPQILWRPRKWLFGMITVALHPNTMTDKDFDNLEKFIEKNQNKIGNFSELINWYDRQNVIIKFLTFFTNQAFKFCWWIIFKLKYGLSR